MTAARVDSHQHFWKLSRGDYSWLTPDNTALYRDFLPEDLEPQLSNHGIDATVVVQAAPTLGETEYLLELAEETDWIAGVVGWINMESSDAIHHLERLALHPFFAGIRPMIQDIPDPNWMLRPQLTPVFEELQNRQLCFDALVHPAHLENLNTLLESFPDLRTVIDHGAKPDIESGDYDGWAAEIEAVAKSTNALCKLSGLVTEAGQNWSFESIEPVMDTLYESFGPTRLLWGSDWPVVNLTGDYSSWRHATEKWLNRLPENERDLILGRNAIRFYTLEGIESD